MEKGFKYYPPIEFFEQCKYGDIIIVNVDDIFFDCGMQVKHVSENIYKFLAFHKDNKTIAVYSMDQNHTVQQFKEKEIVSYCFGDDLEKGCYYMCNEMFKQYLYIVSKIYDLIKIKLQIKKDIKLHEIEKQNLQTILDSYCISDALICEETQETIELKFKMQILNTKGNKYFYNMQSTLADINNSKQMLDSCFEQVYYLMKIGDLDKGTIVLSMRNLTKKYTGIKFLKNTNFYNKNFIEGE